MQARLIGQVRRMASFAVLLSILMSGCRSATAPERHTRPSGVVVTSNGTELVRVAGGTSTGTLTVPAGGQSPELTFTFLDAQGGAITPPSDYHLELQFANPNIASFQPAGSPYSFRGHIQGLQAGATTVRIRFMHGPPGNVATHADFSSNPPTEVVVN